MTRILIVNQINPEKEMLQEAAEAIQKGGIVVFPTETVYGIGADAFNPEACKKIFEIKKRPMDNPLIVHIADYQQLREVSTDLDGEFLKVAKVLWPGPVTFILKKSKKVPDEVSAGLETIAVRMPAHPVALALIRQSGTPIAAPSANISKKPSSTKAEHVIKDFDGKVDVILDGGDTAFGLESTIIDMTVAPHVLLRPGAFTIEELQRYLGPITIPDSINRQLKESETAIAPGMKYRHYAPDKKLLAIKKELIAKISRISGNDKRIAVLCSNEIADELDVDLEVIKLGNEENLYEIAKNLFDAFRKLEKMEIEVAFVEMFPERGIGLAIRNRTLKAAGSDPIDSFEKLKDCF